MQFLYDDENEVIHFEFCLKLLENSSDISPFRLNAQKLKQLLNPSMPSPI